MGPAGSTARRRSPFLLALAVLAAVGVLSVSIGGTPASAKPKLPAISNCAKFPVGKIGKLLGVGKMYLDHTLVHGGQCTYYGVPAKTANEYPKSVPYTQIKYIPALLISITDSTKVLYHYQELTLDSEAEKKGFSVSGVDPKLGVGNDARVYSGTIDASEFPDCEPEIEYNNWTGPPICSGEPSQQKVTVLAYQGASKGIGQLVMVAAAAQTPPEHLKLLRIEKIAKGAFTGQFP